MAQLSCPKCQAAMLRGFIIDHTAYGARSVSSWAEGAPRPSFWAGVKVGPQEPIAVETWRCVRCGYLENYAKA
ncbi:MAG: hypothetical protein ACREH4_00745 [Vitreimonas sp.]